jgi:hypothetical protein
MNKLRIDINPLFTNIADYYWDHMDPQNDGSIWEWLLKDYGVVRIGPMADRHNRTWVKFPDEAHLSLFLLRWS